jgi:hypothetical protein
LQIIFGLFALSPPNSSFGIAVPIEIVIKQLRSNIPRKMIPLISELKREDNTKKLIKINGANLNPIYIIDCTFKTLIIF